MRINAHEGEALSAFADDIAIVLRSFERLHDLHILFKEFELASALVLNDKKTVVVPLVSGCAETAAAAVRYKLVGTALSEMSVSVRAVRIGIPIGPCASIGATSTQ
jgi:hypothetical protein